VACVTILWLYFWTVVGLTRSLVNTILYHQFVPFELVTLLVASVFFCVCVCLQLNQTILNYIFFRINNFELHTSYKTDNCRAVCESGYAKRLEGGDERNVYGGRPACMVIRPGWGNPPVAWGASWAGSLKRGGNIAGRVQEDRHDRDAKQEQKQEQAPGPKAARAGLLGWLVAEGESPYSRTPQHARTEQRRTTERAYSCPTTPTDFLSSLVAKKKKTFCPLSGSLGGVLYIVVTYKKKNDKGFY
jgi:hypothetical protein